MDVSALKEDLKEYTDYFFRRVNKFIILSLMGVHRCTHALHPGESIAVYLCTENGNLGDTENVLHQLYHENSFPKPFNFINTMSNTASFYVAQSLKSRGRSITVSSKNVSFERGLELAWVDFEMKNITEALIGGVDEAVYSREHFAKKYDVQYHDLRLVDGSSWLYLTALGDEAIGEISDIKTFDDRNDAFRWIKGLQAAGPIVLAFGILITSSEKALWRNEFPRSEELEYLREYGFYDTMTSFAVSTFFRNFSERILIHVNKNIQGRYVVLACKKY